MKIAARDGRTDGGRTKDSLVGERERDATSSSPGATLHNRSYRTEEEEEDLLSNRVAIWTCSASFHTLLQDFSGRLWSHDNMVHLQNNVIDARSENETIEKTWHDLELRSDEVI